MFQSSAGKYACKFLIEDEILRELGHKRDTISNAVKKLRARPYKKQKKSKCGVKPQVISFALPV